MKISSTCLNSAPSPWLLFLLQNIPTQAPGMMDSFSLPYLIPTTLRHEEGLGGREEDACSACKVEDNI